MNRRRPTTRWALWVFAAALLLKAAMPWLASASAEAQGKTLVEVCTVYGMATVPMGGGSPADAPHPASDHGGEHCALTALAALAGPDDLPWLALILPSPAASPLLLARPSPRAADASATWVARLKHGPPAFA